MVIWHQLRSYCAFTNAAGIQNYQRSLPSSSRILFRPDSPKFERGSSLFISMNAAADRRGEIIRKLAIASLRNNLEFGQTYHEILEYGLKLSGIELTPEAYLQNLKSELGYPKL